MVYRAKTSSGFSLVETLLYVALFSVIISAFAVFLATLSASRINQQVTAEVDQQASFVLRTISQAARNATTINSPSAGFSASSLSLNTGVASTTPTVFSLSGGKVFITEGVSSAIALTNSRVSVTGLNFTNLTRSGGKGVVRTDLTVKAGAASPGRAEYNYQADYHGSASLRQ